MIFDFFKKKISEMHSEDFSIINPAHEGDAQMQKFASKLSISSMERQASGGVFERSKSGGSRGPSTSTLFPKPMFSGQCTRPRATNEMTLKIEEL